MGVLNWMQSRLHGSHHSKRKSELSAASARPAGTSDGLPRTDALDDGWTTAMLPIGTFGMREGRGLKRSCDGSDGSCTVGFDELKKLREEVTLLMRTKGVATAEELNRVHHLPLERLLNCTSNSMNGGLVNPISFRKLVTGAGAISGFLPPASFRETVPEMRFHEIIWGLLLKNAHPENSAFSNPVIRNDRAVQTARKGKEEVEDEGGKWIRTDSEYIVLEI